MNSLLAAGLFIIFEPMQLANVSGVLTENAILGSEFLKRDITTSFYLPKNVADPSAINLLLINDGQNMKELGLEDMLNSFYSEKLIQPLLCVGIHAGTDRKNEYGIASQVDYLGRGSKAAAYTSFIREELIPYIQKTYALSWFREKAFAGFSLGALSAMDITLNHPGEFTKAGLFSGSFWWRSIDQTEDDYDDNKHRIIHQLVRNGKYHPGLKFFFQCGNMDETMDRNNNGIIDSIDDTLDLINELVNKGYNRDKDIHYMQLLDGRHDIATWARAMPVFLKWGWGINS